MKLNFVFLLLNFLLLPILLHTHTLSFYSFSPHLPQFSFPLISYFLLNVSFICSSSSSSLPLNFCSDSHFNLFLLSHCFHFLPTPCFSSTSHPFLIYERPRGVCKLVPAPGWFNIWTGVTFRRVRDTALKLTERVFIPREYIWFIATYSLHCFLWSWS
jgi:hypothetical protein